MRRPDEIYNACKFLERLISKTKSKWKKAQYQSMLKALNWVRGYGDLI